MSLCPVSHGCDTLASRLAHNTGNLVAITDPQEVHLYTTMPKETRIVQWLALRRWDVDVSHNYRNTALLWFIVQRPTSKWRKRKRRFDSSSTIIRRTSQFLKPRVYCLPNNDRPLTWPTKSQDNWSVGLSLEAYVFVDQVRFSLLLYGLT
jgi:hypothetical protein